MYRAVKRWVGLALLLTGLAWLLYAQLRIMMAPVRVASEASFRHFPDREELSRRESIDLAFTVAREVRDSIPSLLVPTLLLLWGSYWFYGSKRTKPDKGVAGSSATGR